MNKINHQVDGIAEDQSVTQTIRVNVGNLVRIVSRSLDYVGVDDIRHAHRTATMVATMADALGYPTALRELAHNAALLHDCGVSSTREERVQIDEFVWHDAQNHALRGASYLEACTTLAKYAPYVKYHHTPWPELKDLDIPDEEKTLNALIFICDRADKLYCKTVEDYGDNTAVLLHKQEIIDKIASRRGDLFRSDLVDAFLEVAKSDSFWLTLTEDFISHAISSNLAEQQNLEDKPISTVHNIAIFLARIIDAKSSFTEQHSERVALLAEEIATMMNVSPLHTKKLAVAGLMHDIGKLRIKNDVLDKQGPLTDLERAAVKKHCIDTRIVLDLLFPESPIGLWASCHHEKIDGSGYPYGYTKEELDLEARILTVCDIFQALTQERPYRENLSLEAALGIMAKMEAEGQLDPDVMRVLRNNAPHLYTLSTE